MKRFKSLLLAAAFVSGLVAGALFAPEAEAGGHCYKVGCSVCCYLPGGGIACTSGQCP